MIQVLLLCWKILVSGLILSKRNVSKSAFDFILLFLLLATDMNDPEFTKIGHRFLKLYLQVFGASTDFIKWAEEVVTAANTRAMYPIMFVFSFFVVIVIF